MGQKTLHHKAVPLLSLKSTFFFPPEERMREVL